MLRRVFSLPDSLIVIASFGLLSPVWLLHRALFWGTPALQFVPWRMLSWELLSSGQLPLWNPYSGMGAPLIANYQSGLFYPPNWSYFLLAALGGATALAWGQALLVSLHLAWSGVGMARLLRHLGLSTFSQTVGGITFCFSGYLVARAGFLSINESVAWLPWIILAADKLVVKVQESQPLNRLFNATIILSLPLALQLLSGHAQTSWYTILLVLLWVGFWANRPEASTRNLGDLSLPYLHFFSFRKRIRIMGKAYLFLGIGILLAVSIAGVQLLPTAEYLLQSQRSSAVDFEYGMTYSFWPWRILTLLIPGLFGNPISGNYWGYANYWEDAIYVGLLPLFLAISTIWSAIKNLIRRRQETDQEVSLRSRFILFLAVVILLGFVFAFGKNSPIFPWLYYHIPTFDMFDAPTRFTIWVEFCIPILAGLGAQSWRRPVGRSLYWTRLGVAGATAVGIGAGLTAFLMKDIKPTFIHSTAMAGMWGVGAGILSLISPESQSHKGDSTRKWSWVVCLFILVDLFVAGLGLNPGLGTSLYVQPNTLNLELQNTVGDGRIYLPAQDEKVLKFTRFFRFDSFIPQHGFQDWENLRYALLPDLNLLDHISSVNNFDPLVPGRYARWMEVLEKSETAVVERMLNLMDVKIVESVDDSQPLGIRFTRRQAFPRIRWVACGRSVKDEGAALAQVLGDQWNPEEEVILEADTPANPAPCISTGGAVFQAVSENANRVNVRYRSETPGYLVVADTWYPGWFAMLDGQPTRIWHANYLFRAIYVPAGEHQLVLVYRPLVFYLGAVVSLLALVGILLYNMKMKSELY